MRFSINLCSPHSLATIDKRIRQLNETVTDGFRYTLFALETLQEETLFEEEGNSTWKTNSSFILDNSTSFNFERFDKLKNSSNENLQKSTRKEEGGDIGSTESFFNVDNSSSLELDWFDQLQNDTNAE